LIPTGEPSGLLTRIATPESVSSPDERRHLNELAFESDRRKWDKRNLLRFQFHSRRVNRKTLRWEEVSEALMRHEKKPGRNTTWPFGRNSPIESTGYSIYFPVGAGAGATTSLCCCAQAPSSKAVTRTATVMIIFRNFNLSRLLSSQVAPFRLGAEPRRSNAFLHFFEPSQIGRPDLFRVASGACACGHYFLLFLRTISQSQGS
jgi:hypothetical protein